jgi:hypothetical protein
MRTATRTMEWRSSTTASRQWRERAACYRDAVRRDDESRDPRYGHDLSAVQNAEGVDLLLLREQLSIPIEERFRRLERQLEFLLELKGAANR